MRKKIIQCCYFVLHTFFCFFFKIKKQLFIFTNNYYDSPRFIFEKMHEKYPDFKLVWMIPKNTSIDTCSFPSYITFKRYSMLVFMKHLVSSFCVVNNYGFNRMYRKRKKQFFIQTYHGDRGPKKVLYDVKKNDGRVRDEFITDLCVSGSEFGKKRYMSAFDYRGEIYNYGMPRNDQLVSKSDANRNTDIKRKLNIPLDKKIVLYAPTFRDNQNNSNFNNNVNEILKVFPDYIVLTRKHTSTAKSFSFVNSSRVIDVSKYNDVADVLCVTDFLISDYSSIPYDFALTGRPIILLINDFEEYTKDSRELMFLIDEPGLKTARSYEELASIVKNTSIEEYERIDKKALDFFKTNETGKSSEIICDRIALEYYEKNNKSNRH